MRHGEADHNVEGNEGTFEFTVEDKPVLNTDLTEVGRQQAVQVAGRLANQTFNFAISSDLKRAKDTGNAIALQNDTIHTVEEWKTVRERSLGIFEGKIPDLCVAQLTVEEAIEDKDLLTWRIPNGESVVDLKMRVLKFLHQLINQTKYHESNELSILVVSHGLFLSELHGVLSTFGQSGPLFGKGKVFHPNTGVSQYKLELEEDTEDIKKVDCIVHACGEHLQGEGKEQTRRKKSSTLLHNHCCLEELETQHSNADPSCKIKRK